MIIQEIHSFEEYEDFICELARHPLYSDPHFTHNRNNLYYSLERKDEFAFAVLDNRTIEGLFVWLIIPEEQYIEMIIGFTRNEEAFSEMLSYMEKKYPGFKLDFVFNPLNTAISRPLKAKGALFNPEQQKMLHMGTLPDVSTECVELYSERWKDHYCRLHRTETYWTAERVISALYRFSVLLAVKEGKVQGYLDVTHCYDENEIYDLFVKPESAQQGYEMAMLAKAIELNGQHKMMVLVDVDNEAETELYAAAGFKRMEGYNSVLASYRTEKE